jgi:hypothetical protein
MLAHPSASHSQTHSKLTLPLSNPFAEIIPTDVCDAIRKAHTYDGKVVRIRAIWYRTFEGSTLYPYNSDTCGDLVRVRLDCPNDAACKEMNDTLKTNLVGDEIVGRIGVVVVGRFRYRRFLTGRDIHTGSHYEFDVARIEEVLKIPNKNNGNQSPQR